MALLVTLDDIARNLGLNRSTVSLSLRGSPKIPAATRTRGLAEASRLGYRPIPLVTALMRARRNRGATKGVVVAYITNYPTRFGWRPAGSGLPDYFRGAEARAAELGVKLEHFWLGEPGMTPDRMSEILRSRGINGIIIGRLPAGQGELHLRWEYFSIVALGMTLEKPGLHRVAEDFFAGASEAMHQLLRRGYRRVGFVFSEPDDCKRVSDQWRAATVWNQIRQSPQDLIPAFEYKQGLDNSANFLEWLRRTKPDAVLATHGKPVMEWLRAGSLKAPRDIGLAVVNSDHHDSPWSGIYCSADRLGALAAEMVIGQMYRCETGIPSNPHQVLFCGEWVEGSTLALART